MEGAWEEEVFRRAFRDEREQLKVGNVGKPLSR